MTDGTVTRGGGLPMDGRLLVGGVLLLALLARLAATAFTVGFATPAALEPSADSRIHIALVESLLRGGGFSLHNQATAITPPLYIFLLAALYGTFGNPETVRVLQAIMGAASCGLLYLIGRRLLSPLAGLIGAAILAVSPVTALVAALHLTENLFLLLLLATVWQATNVQQRPSTAAILGLGVVMGLTALTRSVFLAFVPFFVVWALLNWGWRNAVAYRVVILAGLAMAGTIMPWVVRNYAVYGEPVLVQSNGGMVFWAGNNPKADGGLTWPTAATWTATTPPDDGNYGWRDLTLSQENRRYTDAAISWMRTHPGEYLRLLGRKMERLYGVSRAATKGDMSVPTPVILFQIAFFALAAAGFVLARAMWKRLTLLLLLVVFTNVTVLLFSGSTRYAMPMMPTLCLLAALPLATAWDRLTAAQRRPTLRAAGS